jgi:hypothetical protein
MYVKNFIASGNSDYSQNRFAVTYCDYVADDVGYYDPNCETDHTITDNLMY